MSNNESVRVNLNPGASLLSRGNNILKLGTETNNGMTEHTRIDLEFLVEFINDCWVCVELHQPLTKKIKGGIAVRIGESILTSMHSRNNKGPLKERQTESTPVDMDRSWVVAVGMKKTYYP